MTYDSLVNRGDYFSAHYLAEVLPKDLKKKDGLLARWSEREKAGEQTPRSGLRALRKPYFRDRAFFAEFLENIREGGTVRQDPEDWRKALHELHGDVLRALGFQAEPRTLLVERADKQYEVAVAHAEPHDRPSVVAIECGWAPDVDAALDPDQAGLLLTPVELDNRETIETGDRLASWLFAGDEPPRYVLILAGGVIVLADRMTWGEGRYLAVSLDVALGRSNALPAELDTIAALFGADSLLPPEEGGTEKLAELLAGSRQHAVGVSKDLRDGLRDSVEIIANEVLDRIREQNVRPDQIMEPAALAKELGRESLRYLYRILFLLYAEARPELGILPTDDEAYVKGYSMARIGDLIVRDLVSEESRRGFHLYESLDLLFRMVNEGHNPRRGVDVESDDEGLRFEPLKADLFDPTRTCLIGEIVLDEDDPEPKRLDTRLRNEALYKVLRLLMLAKGKRKERGGFISYAQLGINQLGAVYEGLMSYTGFIANEELYEVAKNGDPKDGSWMIPASKIDDYDDAVFVRRTDENGIKTDERVRYKPGAFVYRLAGRDRQTSASYYTPESLTQVTVQLALRERLDQDGTTTRAREILDWTICEPALGSGAFLNEAINQVAAEYLKRRQAELNEEIPAERYPDELQKVKAYIALHNSYGVDLNETAVELAEVSLWLNVMYPGLQAPWFGLHLRRGNSLIGAGRRLYAPADLKKKAWLTTAPKDHPFREGTIPSGHIHHFLLPAQGWGAVAGEKEAKNLAPDEAKALANWRKALLKDPAPKKKQGQSRSQVERLQGLSRRAEYLWSLVIKRLELSEREISRRIDVWGAEDLPQSKEAISREDVLKNLTLPGTPYWRLKTVMDAWCALWFWPLDKVGLLDGSDEIYERLKPNALPTPAPEPLEAPDPEPTGFPETWEAQSLFGESPVQEKITVPKPRPRPKPKPKRIVRRQVIPLADLDDWLDFAEALLGTDEVSKEMLFPEFDLLSQMDDLEDELPAWMGMEDPWHLGERFPWLDTAEDIAKEQGFFHWELHYAQIFNKGGFDLQVGNPPWVRPRWEESPILAELEPWFELAEKPSATEWRKRKTIALNEGESRQFFLHEYAGNVAFSLFLCSVASYPLMVGLAPNLYRAFMIRVWENLGRFGIAGLIHPDSHFTGAREGRLRAAAYRRLRMHAHFQNRRLLFADIDWNIEFGVQVYGAERAIGFVHVSWLYDVDALINSFEHDGAGEHPGIKYQGYWDLRPHRDRLTWVDEETLQEWRLLTGSSDVSVVETKLLYPVTTAERAAISAISSVKRRLGELQPQITAGYDETGAVREGLIEWKVGFPRDWSEVIVRGPQFAAATPFAKQPPKMGRNDPQINVATLSPDAVPSTSYQRATDLDRFQRAQDRWVDRHLLAALRNSPEELEDARKAIALSEGIPFRDVTTEAIDARLEEKSRKRYAEFYRVFWREMIPNNTERSVYAALMPPGPTHILGVRSMALSSKRETAAVAGLWTSIPIDYILRVTGRGHLGIADACSLPCPDMNHPLMEALLLRTLRLNCLTAAYAPLWRELFSVDWRSDSWTCRWDGIDPLHEIDGDWTPRTPLRTELARRAAMVELDVLAALMLGIGVQELTVLYRSRFPQMAIYESAMWFDRKGRRVAENFNAYGHGQNKEDYKQLIRYLADPQENPPPEGYTPPFYKADREAEYRQAHAVFSERLEQAKAEGWTPADGNSSG
ncbi:class I SAM-dependent DNA methyltransferase [Actinomadura sp. NPDC047616]|uniref:class I SAM-dependent DNA methyltransferase n=1 Tax=Actinomadura sp. NPDC047616 TaxID=3155914 RepID=UPI0033CB2B33